MMGLVGVLWGVRSGSGLVLVMLLMMTLLWSDMKCLRLICSLCVCV